MAEMTLTVVVRDDSPIVSLRVQSPNHFTNVPLALQRAIETLATERDQYQLCPHHRATTPD